MRPQPTISGLLHTLGEGNPSDRVSILDIKNALHESSFGLLMIFFALPVAVLPPGTTWIPAIPLIIFSIQMMAGMAVPWLPGWIGGRTIRRGSIARGVKKWSPLLRWMERWMKPRFAWVLTNSGEMLMGVSALIFSISILMPFPFMSFIPSLGIMLMALGLLGKDGIIILSGLLVGYLGIMVTGVTFMLGGQLLAELLGAG